MRASRWVSALLRRLAPPGGAEDVLGDLEEAHRNRLKRRGRVIASMLTALEGLDMAFALLRGRARRGSPTGPATGSQVTLTRGGRKGPSISWLDVKLGFRMLAKYPGLTTIGGLAIAVSIGIGTAFFAFVHQFIDPDLPLDDGDRVVGVVNWDVEARSPEFRSVHDFERWREQVKSIEDIGAYNSVQRNVVTEEGVAEPLRIAEISASAFRVARVSALLGRTLVEADEEPGADQVVVIGYDVWQRRFGGDADIVGQTIRLNDVVTAVVGVMPRGFGFPVNHGSWVPFRADAADYERLEGPTIRVFGRLTSDASLEEAKAELAAIGARAASDYPSTNQHLRPTVVPYAEMFASAEFENVLAVYGVNSVFVLLLLIAGLNVATLTFARALARESEFAVRSALGAGRGRIVVQMFVEALILVAIAAVVGLVAATLGLRWVMNLVWLPGEVAAPFWWSAGLSGTSVVYAIMLALACATVIGVLPALRVTGRLAAGLQQPGTRGSSARFGLLWTAVIVVQVALSVAVLPTAVSAVRDALEYGWASPGFPIEEYASVRLEADRRTPGTPGDTSTIRLQNDFEAYQRELERRLRDEAGAVAVAFATRPPGTNHPTVTIEVEDANGIVGPLRQRVSTASVDVDFFDAMRVPILAGRPFHAGDLGSSHGVVIVNEPFVREVLVDRNPIGRRVREIVDDSVAGPWKEIVGVVRDPGMNPIDPSRAAGFYSPLEPGGVTPVHMIVHAANRPEALMPRIRSLSYALDPAVRLYDLDQLDEAGKADRLGFRALVGVLALFSATALLLSSAGTHALMSFVVTQRRREIGICLALGAKRQTVLGMVFSRAFLQLGAGGVVGGVIGGLVATGDSARSNAVLLVTTLVVLLAVGLLASAVPVLRALRIQPSEVLRDG